MTHMYIVFAYYMYTHLNVIVYILLQYLQMVLFMEYISTAISSDVFFFSRPLHYILSYKPLRILFIFDYVFFDFYIFSAWYLYK